MMRELRIIKQWNNIANFFALRTGESYDGSRKKQQRVSSGR